MKGKMLRKIRNSTIIVMAMMVALSMCPANLQPDVAKAGSEGKISSIAAKDNIVQTGNAHVNSDIAETKEPKTGYAIGKEGSNQHSDLQTRSDAAKTSEAKSDSKQKIRTKSTSGSIAGGAISWSITNGILTLSGKGKIDDYSNNYGTNAAPWNANYDEITSIVVNEGITGIGKLAFSRLTYAKSVSLPQSLTFIGEAAFYQCESLTKFTVPKNIKDIPTAMLAECGDITEIVIPEGVQSIGIYAFQGISATTVNIPSTVKSLNSCAFMYAKVKQFSVAAANKYYTSKDGVIFKDGGATLFLCPEYKTGTSYTVPSGVKTIGDYAFSSNTTLKNISFSGVKTLGEGAFNKSALAGGLTIPDSVTKAGYFTFCECMDITSLRFGSGLTETPFEMFYKCSGLKTIAFGSKLKKIGMNTFNYCSGLENVKIPANITEMEGCFGYCTSLESFESEKITSIWYASFAGDRSLSNVNLKNVERINREAFNGCKSLDSITLPKTTKFVDSTAFPMWTKITCLNSELTPYGYNGLEYADNISVKGKRHYKMAFQVLDLVNAERSKKNLPALTMNKGLLETAMVRSAEGSVLFSHTRPDSSICYTANEDMHAENIALGQTTAKSAMNSWMNSSGHKANIMASNAKSIGIGCFETAGRLSWTQCFTVSDIEGSVSKGSYRDTADTVASIKISKEPFMEAPGNSDIVWSFGKSGEYSFEFAVKTNKNRIDINEKMNAGMQVKNPGTNMYVPIENNGVKWQSSNSSVASVGKDGTITGKKKGAATISGSLKWFSAKQKVQVGTDTGSSTAGIKKQPMKAKGKTVVIKRSKLKKKSVYVKRSKVMVIKKAKGKLSFKKVKGSKRVIVKKKTGKVLVKKGLKKGKYKVKVKVTAAGTKVYKKGSRTVTFKIIVR